MNLLELCDRFVHGRACFVTLSALPDEELRVRCSKVGLNTEITKATRKVLEKSYAKKLPNNFQKPFR